MVLLLRKSKDIQTMERRSSSPIGIPNAKFFSAKEHRIEDEDEEQYEEYDQYLNSQKNVSVTKGQVRPVNKQIMRLKSEEPTVAPPKETQEDISDSPPSLPDCSPTFAAVLDEISPNIISPPHEGLENIKWPELISDNHRETQLPISTDRSPLIQRRDLPAKPQPRVRIQSASTHSFSNSSPRVRSWSLNAKKYKKPVPKNEPSSTHSTPALSRKKKTPNKPHVIQPKYVFKNESLSVSHDDIVRQQQRDELLFSEELTPKSIFELNLQKLKITDSEYE